MPNCLHVPLAQNQLQKPPLTLPGILIPLHQDSSLYDTQRAKCCEESVTVFPAGQHKNGRRGQLLVTKIKSPHHDIVYFTIMLKLLA